MAAGQAHAFACPQTHLGFHEALALALAHLAIRLELRRDPAHTQFFFFSRVGVAPQRRSPLEAGALGELSGGYPPPRTVASYCGLHISENETCPW